MSTQVPAAVNDTQREFKKLCKVGGGTKGGPAPGKVLELLRSSGKSLNAVAFQETAEHLEQYKDANPWHVCYAVALAWGHLAKLDIQFTGAVVHVLSNWNDEDLSAAKSFYLDRGPEPIEQSLIGAYQLFAKVTLPKVLPGTLAQLDTAQQRWLSPILSPARPRYIGSWNATAMFMVALFAQPALAKQHVEPRPVLPPGGPITAGLSLLYRTHVTLEAPAGNDLDDAAFEPGALYLNNALMAKLLDGCSDWSMIDVHSGLYMLGTRDPHSATWV